MFKISFVLAVALLATSSLGCSVDECDKHAERPQCQPTPPDVGTGGVLTISPRRINIKGDMVVVTPSAKTTPADEVKITQPGMADVVLGKLGTGKVTVPALTASQVSLGKAYLVIGANAPEPIRLYLKPSFGTSTLDISTGNESSLWAGIVANRTIVSLNDSGSGQPPVHYAEYNYQSKSISFVGGNNYPSTAKGSATIMQKYVGYPNAYSKGHVAFRSCNLGSDTCSTIQTNNNSLLDMTVDRRGTVLAALLDGRINAYFIDVVFGDKSPAMLVNDIAGPKLIASEDFDGDGLSDLLIWNDVNMNVLRQMKSGATTGFALDSGLSGQITAALGSDKPTALVTNDLDGDGLVDVIYASGTQINWLTNTSEATAKFAKGGALSTVGGGIDSLTVGDVDADSKGDLVVASKSDKTIKIFINQSTY